ncbi:MAG TPA: response regulator, partial [Calditrichaeota bacterium]|nr:response regulator [Calditrichota bacterium]
IEFLERIKKIAKFSSIPVIFLSALSDGAIQMNAFDLGAVDYITKPVKKELFLSKIRALLQSYYLKKTEDSIFLEGTKQDKEIDVLMSVCETEKITGFAVFFNEGQTGVLHFNGGILEKIEAGETKDADAFDKLTSWNDYRFVIFYGSYDQNLVQRYFEDKQNILLPKQERSTAEDGYTNHKKMAEGAIESFIFSADLKQSILGTKNLRYSGLYSAYEEFTRKAAKFLDQNPVQAALEFTDNKILKVRYGKSENQLILFKNKESAKAFSEER